MAQHIWVKWLISNIEYKWNFADFYNLIDINNDDDLKILLSINIYDDTIVKLENKNKLISELKVLHYRNKFANEKIKDFIFFLNSINEDIIFIWD